MSQARQWDASHWTVGFEIIEDGELIGKVEAVEEHEQGATLYYDLENEQFVESSDVEVRP